MKKLLKGLAFAGVAGLMALTTACGAEETPAGIGAVPVFPEHDETEYTYTYNYWENDLDLGWANMQEFRQFNGTIADITHFYEKVEDGHFAPTEGRYTVLVRGEETEEGYSPTVNFEVDFTTALLLDGELEIGMQVQAFYEVGPAMILIYPPQHNARALVAADKDVIVNRFDEIPSATEITFQDGTLFEGDPSELQNRALVVINEGNQTQVVVLFEIAVHPILELSPEDLAGFDTGFDEGAGFGGGALQLSPAELNEMWDNMFNPETVQIIVNNQFIESPRPFIDREVGLVMVPVAPIAETLGYTVIGEGFEMVIAMYGAPARGIAFVENLDAYMIGRMETISLGAPPALVDGELFVPFNFFGQVIEANAWIIGGEVVVSNVDGDDMM
ncbi:MAG: copper amine oxidase N-terminal domain-containing protein [Defluviitaleaceae bacterium]|nr:copper amine oxidase N-terminal domain-containing protein [Defluviitaleaceae bacterium]